MPEIAEVRVVADALKRQILHKKIERVNVLYSGIIESDRKSFSHILEGRSFENIETYGKWLIFNLGDKTLLSHLRMEGKYFFVPSDKDIGKHEHIIFNLEGGMDLRYSDVRKFGKMLIVDTDKTYETDCLKKLGPEPESSDLTNEYLLDKFKRKDIPIKTALLDQTIINGLGNIYANEVLFAARISPLRNSNRITKEECSSIISESRRIVKRSYELGGCTIRSYTSSLGVIGHFQDELQVHMKDGKTCPICGQSIKKVKIDGRSSYYCEKCQK